MSKKEKFKMIMVNSFKGGTGKSSLALSHCIHEWKRMEESKDREETEEEIYYSNIYYVDIDRLGTSMSYYLFPEGSPKPCYFENYRKGEAEQVSNEVALSPDSKGKLYAVLLNPVANRKQDYDVHGRMQQHEKNNNTIFEAQMLDFLEECMNMGTNSLFVVDCSPGLSEMERRLLKRFYDLQEKYDLCVEELYVTTFENGQIRKTIECLNDCADEMYWEKREVSIVLNDLQNCIKTAQKKDSGLRISWEEAAEGILGQLSDKTNVKIRYKEYNEKQMKGGIVNNVKNLNNNTDAYVLLKEYREDYISEKRKDGK